MNRTVNDYIQRNWEQIRSDIVLNNTNRYEATFDAGRAVGEGFFNRGQGGIGPRQAMYHQTSLVTVTIELVPGNPPSFVVVRAYPSGSGR